ncbi:MAG: hypothetical protein SFU56_04535 [Capsulimonadales bacterium]|nr:hypothetical protein [Capsulimonadales bacterium]
MDWAGTYLLRSPKGRELRRGNLPAGILEWAMAFGRFDRPEIRQWRRLLGKDLLPECAPIVSMKSPEALPDLVTAVAFSVSFRTGSPESDSASVNPRCPGVTTETVRLYRVGEGGFFVGQHNLTGVMFFLCLPAPFGPPFN